MSKIELLREIFETVTLYIYLYFVCVVLLTQLFDIQIPITLPIIVVGCSSFILTLLFSLIAKIQNNRKWLPFLKQSYYLNKYSFSLNLFRKCINHIKKSLCENEWHWTPKQKVEEIILPEYFEPIDGINIYFCPDCKTVDYYEVPNPIYLLKSRDIIIDQAKWNDNRLYNFAQKILKNNTLKIERKREKNRINYFKNPFKYFIDKIREKENNLSDNIIIKDRFFDGVKLLLMPLGYYNLHSEIRFMECSNCKSVIHDKKLAFKVYFARKQVREKFPNIHIEVPIYCCHCFGAFEPDSRSTSDFLPNITEREFMNAFLRHFGETRGSISQGSSYIANFNSFENSSGPENENVTSGSLPLEVRHPLLTLEVRRFKAKDMINLLYKLFYLIG